MCILMQVPTESRGLKSPGVGTVGVHASPNVGAENQTWVLWKSIKCSYHRGISPSWLAFPKFSFVSKPFHHANKVP